MLNRVNTVSPNNVDLYKTDSNIMSGDCFNIILISLVALLCLIRQLVSARIMLTLHDRSLTV